MPIPDCFLDKSALDKHHKKIKQRGKTHHRLFCSTLYHQDQIATLHCDSVAIDHLLKSCRILLDSSEQTEAQLRSTMAQPIQIPSEAHTNEKDIQSLLMIISLGSSLQDDSMLAKTRHEAILHQNKIKSILGILENFPDAQS